MSRYPVRGGKTGWSVALVVGLLLAVLPPDPRAADGPYEQGRAALDQKQWERAETLFREAARAGGDRADDALYWRAYALGKLSRVDQALRVLDELERTHPESPWLDDAEELRDELRGEAAVDDSDTNLKSMALMALEAGKPHTVSFPNGRKATVTLKEIKDGAAKLKVQVAGLINTDLTLGREGSLYQHVGAHNNGNLMLVLSPITAK